MKNKNKKSIMRKKKEFRYHKIQKINERGKKKTLWHPAYVFFEKGNIYIYVSLTHSKEVQTTLLIKLRKNPNPKDERDSYRLVEIKEDTKDKFGRRVAGWELDEQDDKELRDEYKKR